jgi:hypothetical protein
MPSCSSVIPVWREHKSCQRRPCLQYFETLFRFADEDDYRFLIVFLHRDYDQLWDAIKDTAPSFHKAWKDTGLLNGEGEPRPAHEVWQRWFEKDHAAPAE